MKTILVCNSKGGVGKSLIADELAFSFERTGTPMNFYDLDSQGGTIHATSTRDDAAVAVVDTPGALQKELVTWIGSADLIVIPTRTTSRDIEPLQRMQKAVAANAPETPVIYVLNAWNRWKASSDFMEWFAARAGGSDIMKLPQSEQFVQASAYQKSVCAYAKSSKAAKAMTELVELVRRKIGLEPEWDT